MNERILKRKVDIDNFYLIYLKTMNGHLSLTNRELAILIELCKLQDSNKQFDKESREDIRTRLEISSFNLNNIIKSLKDQKLITKEGKDYVVNSRLFVPSTDKEYSINFKIEIV